MKNFILFFLIGFILGLVFLTSNAKAVVWTWKFACHCPPGNLSNCQTLRLPNASYDSHLANHPYDYAGACLVPTVTPTPSIEVTPTPEVTPTVTPEVTPTPVVENKPTGGRVDAPQCGSRNVEARVLNPHLYRKQDTAIIKWYPTAGNKAHIYYKQNGSSVWQYAIVVENVGYYEVHGLGTMDVTFAIAQVDECGGGVTSDIYEIVDGNTSDWILYR